jgi:tetratricopeptide (TPR) repeat protein
LLALSLIVSHAQVRAGSPELKLYEQIAAEMNVDTKLELIRSFETQFPASRIMGRVYLIAVEVYRAKQDRGKINEYGEKALQVDPENVTAMMLLARNYAIEAKNLDRAMELARKALERTEQLGKEPIPTAYSASQWKDYLRSNAESAQQILDYVSSMKRRSEDVKSPASNPIAKEVN